MKTDVLGIFCQIAVCLQRRAVQELVEQCQHRVNLKESDEVVYQCRSKPSDKIVDQKPFSAPSVFHRCAKHPQCEHVEEDVAEVGMHEHVGHELPDMEICGAREMQPE